MVCNQVTWLYYALGKCTQLSFAGGTNTGQNPTNYHTGTAAHKLYFHGTSNTSHVDEGPFIYRVGQASYGENHIVPPLLFTVDDTVGDLDSAPYPIAATGQFTTYKFED